MSVWPGRGGIYIYHYVCVRKGEEIACVPQITPAQITRTLGYVHTRWSLTQHQSTCFFDGMRTKVCFLDVNCITGRFIKFVMLLKCFKVNTTTDAVV